MATVCSGEVTGTARVFLPISARQAKKLTAQLMVSGLDEVHVTALDCASPARQELTQLPDMYGPSFREADKLAKELNSLRKTDGEYLKFLAALEAEQVGTFAGALKIAKELDCYTRVTGDTEEYGREALRRMGTPEAAIDSIEGYMDLEEFGRVMMLEDDVRQTQFGLIRKDWGDDFPRPKQTMEMGGMT